MEIVGMSKEEWGRDIKPYDEHSDRRSRRDDDRDVCNEEESRDPNLDPGFSSWDDFYRYMYG